MSAFNDTTLHVYKCPNCDTVATTSVRHTYATPLRCNRTCCGRYMRFLYSEPITTDEQRALAQRGVVYNPTVQRDKTKPFVRIPCAEPGCKGWYSQQYGIQLEGLGSFCSAKCANEAVKRQEAEQAQPPANLLSNGE